MEVELVGVLVERLLLQPLDGAPLLVEVPGALPADGDAAVGDDDIAGDTIE